MLRYLMFAFVLAVAGPAMAHTDSKFTTGPNGGHIIDAGGGQQHWELVANGGQLTLYVTDHEEKPVDTAGGSAEATVLVGGKTYKVSFTPADGNTMKGAGEFVSQKGMKVILKTTDVGGKSFQARLTPMK